MPSRLYNCEGGEITDVNQLEYDQEIWLSYGEQWSDPYCLYIVRVDGACDTGGVYSLYSVDMMGLVVWGVCSLYSVEMMGLMIRGGV